MSCMVPVNSTVASERAWEALLRRREEKMALTPFKLVAQKGEHFLQGLLELPCAVKHTTRTLSGPPSTGAAVAMDAGVADTACYYTGR